MHLGRRAGVLIRCFRLTVAYNADGGGVWGDENRGEDRRVRKITPTSPKTTPFHPPSRNCVTRWPGRSLFIFQRHVTVIMLYLNMGSPPSPRGLREAKGRATLSKIGINYI